MADTGVPHFQNDVGAAAIHIGVREFMCIGATPPFDHPHVYLDMGADSEIICPYCSTLFRHRAELHGGDTDPAGCAWSAQLTGQAAA
ncbi:MAG: zinc-finger domain-containing protein [Beijerinckiaceae bacterium]